MLPRGSAALQDQAHSTIKVRSGLRRTAMSTHLLPDVAETELHELEHALAERGSPKFHARQIFQWVHRRGVTEFAAMTDLGRELRTQLDREFRIGTPEVVRRERSSDGTTKFLLRLADGKHIESVCIPEDDRETFCLSTQVGCAMKCAFCLTGKMGIDRKSTRLNSSH